MTTFPLQFDTLDQVIETMYRSISGPAGAPRDWEAFGAALLPGALLIPLQSDGASLPGVVRSLSYEEYRRTRDPVFERSGFFEFETRRVTDLRGPLAQVYSWFTARTEPQGPDVLRGLNAIQFVRSEHRWWVASLSWYREFDESVAHGISMEGSP